MSHATTAAVVSDPDFVFHMLNVMQTEGMWPRIFRAAKVCRMWRDQAIRITLGINLGSISRMPASQLQYMFNLTPHTMHHLPYYLPTEDVNVDGIIIPPYTPPRNKDPPINRRFYNLCSECVLKTIVHLVGNGTLHWLAKLKQKRAAVADRKLTLSKRKLDARQRRVHLLRHKLIRTGNDGLATTIRKLMTVWEFQELYEALRLCGFADMYCAGPGLFREALACSELRTFLSSETLHAISARRALEHVTLLASRFLPQAA
jgi:hypothetical protein